MMGILKPASLKGVGMIVLQILRVATVITLLTAAVSCWILVITVNKHKPYFVFECISLVFTSFFCVLFIVSELAFTNGIRVYFRRMFPILSDHHGLSWLGVGMMIIACTILGTLNVPADDKPENSAFSSLVMAGGILSFIFGFLNILCSFIWCDRKEGITSRDIRANGSLAESQRQHISDYETSSHQSSIRNEKTRSKFMSMFWKKGDEAPSHMRPKISGPFMSQPPEYDVEHGIPPEDDRLSPIIPGIKRPDTALHPIHTRRSSRYSEADLSRF